MICLSCGKIGHQETHCTKEYNHMEEDNTIHADALCKDKFVPPSQAVESDFGSWMMVKKPPPRWRTSTVDKPLAEAVREYQGRIRIQTKAPKQQRSNVHGSCFEMLEDEILENQKDKEDNFELSSNIR